MKHNREIGTLQERKAAAYLIDRGYEILEYNFQCRNGEIDIVAKDGEYLVFVEVKYRETSDKGYPLEAVSLQKQRRISRTAMYYMTAKGLSYMPVRFDVVGILKEDIELIQNAFDFIY